ncbi:MAG: hypothetical protein ACYTGB_15540 [Planctomycetota bacterium]
MRTETVGLLALALALLVPAAAPAGEKLLLDFEKEECWKLAGHKKEKGEQLEIRYNSYGTYHFMRKGDVTRGEWALGKTYKSAYDPLAKPGGESGLASLQRTGRLLNGFGWMAARGLAGDWSGFDRLRVDVKSTDAPARVQIRVADRATVPLPERRYEVPAGKWVTLEFDLAAAAGKARLERISVKPGFALFFRCRETALYPARVLDRKDVYGAFINLLKCDAPTTMLLDNVRLVPAGADVKTELPLVADKSPWPVPEALPAKTAPMKPERAGAKPSGKIAAGKPVTIDMSGLRAVGYGRMHNDRCGIAALDEKRMLINVATGMNRALLVTNDGGATWKGLDGGKASNQFRGNLMMVGACCTPGDDGQDLLVVTLKHCSGGEEPSYVWFKRIAFDGGGWKPGPSTVVDVDSWHCPEHSMDVLRLPNGRIWAAWSPLSRSGGVKARFSDDDGKTWRSLPGQLATGRHGERRPLLLPYGAGAACFFGTRSRNELSWSHTDGEKWSAVTQPVKGVKGRPLTGAATGPDELFVAAGLKGKVRLLRCSGGKWSEETGAPFPPMRLSAAGGKLVALALRDAKVVMAVRSADGKWSAARELAEAEKGTVDLVCPRVAPKGFLPVAWSTKAGRSVHFLKVPLEP